MANKERIQRWVEALRSGHYMQGRDVLRKTDKYGEDTYCCLGVACDLSQLGKWKNIKDEELHQDDRWVYKIGDHLERYSLPAEVAEWFGIDMGRDHTGSVVEVGNDLAFIRRLIELNDKPVYFDDIADTIEERFLK